MEHADRFLRRFYIEKGMFGSLSVTFIFYRSPLEEGQSARYLFAHWLISDSNPQSPLILVKSLLALSRPRVQLLGPVLSVHGTRTSFACYAGIGCVQRSCPSSSRILGGWFCRPLFGHPCSMIYQPCTISYGAQHQCPMLRQHYEHTVQRVLYSRTHERISVVSCHPIS